MKPFFLLLAGATAPLAVIPKISTAHLGQARADQSMPGTGLLPSLVERRH
ncbi:MAG TPA: hypothetical protein VF690_07395 [Hymenobacter sp.]|jgi:hypothetical protein